MQGLSEPYVAIGDAAYLADAYAAAIRADFESAAVAAEAAAALAAAGTEEQGEEDPAPPQRSAMLRRSAFTSSSSPASGAAKGGRAGKPLRLPAKVVEANAKWKLNGAPAPPAETSDPEQDAAAYEPSQSQAGFGGVSQSQGKKTVAFGKTPPEVAAKHNNNNKRPPAPAAAAAAAASSDEEMDEGSTGAADADGAAGGLTESQQQAQVVSALQLQSQQTAPAPGQPRGRVDAAVPIVIKDPTSADGATDVFAADGIVSSQNTGSGKSKGKGKPVSAKPRRPMTETERRLLEKDAAAVGMTVDQYLDQIEFDKQVCERAKSLR